MSVSSTYVFIHVALHLTYRSKKQVSENKIGRVISILHATNKKKKEKR